MQCSCVQWICRYRFWTSYPKPSDPLSEQAYEGACGRWSGTSSELLGEPAIHYRNSRWHDSLQANGGVRRVVGRLGKGGTAWNEGSCGRGSHQGNQRVVTFVETEVGAPRRTSPTGHQRNASSTRWQAPAFDPAVAMHQPPSRCRALRGPGGEGKGL